VKSNLAYYIYYPFYLLAKYFLNPLADHLSVRHSFYFKKISFLMSDIDFSLCRDKIVDKYFYKKLRTRFRLLKLCIPILGEVNFYEKEVIDEVGNLTNPLEVQRDPLLLSLLGSRPVSRWEKQIFLLKILQSDEGNLKLRIQKRFKKLSYCMEFFSPKRSLIFEDIKSPEKWIDYLEKNVLDCEDRAIVEYLRYFFSLGEKTENVDSILLILNLNLEVPKDFKKLEDSLQKLAIESLKWELWGVYTQLPYTKEMKEVIFHAYAIIATLSELSPDYRNEINYLSHYLSERLG
jgi:hypothetical protein